ncbi:hypothetical protein GIB67_023748 [Kingdonia uniflora]|uniref:Uncharacterized protein n=1 Tax=Kingdonia uniflora TaxID=39325 RepID=A0A7J7LFZ8_9MAGN|nr:hypothetical protein GIB67_023748 [Kingdonia uniflora]
MTWPEFFYGSVVRRVNLWIPRPAHPRISVIGLATDYWILGRDMPSLPAILLHSLKASHRGMNEVQLYTIVHFGEDIIRPKIGSIVSYVGGSTKLTSLRAHSSYEDFFTLLEEINFCSSGKGLSTTKDSGSGKGLSTTKAGGPLRQNSFPDPEPEYRGYPKKNGRGLDPRRFESLVDDDDDIPQSNDFFETICTDVPPLNKPSIPHSNVHLSNEPVLTNVYQSNKPFQTVPTDVPLSNESCISQLNIHLSNKPVLTNIPLSNEPKPIIGQTEASAELRFESQPEQVKDLVDFWFKSIAYTEDLYDFSKEFNIDGTCSCRWWQTMGIPCEYGVRALGLANVNLTTRVSEYFTNDTYKAVYEPIWIPIRGIE